MERAFCFDMSQIKQQTGSQMYDIMSRLGTIFGSHYMKYNWQHPSWPHFPVQERSF